MHGTVRFQKQALYLPRCLWWGTSAEVSGEVAWLDTHWICFRGWDRVVCSGGAASAVTQPPHQVRYPGTSGPFSTTDLSGTWNQICSIQSVLYWEGKTIWCLVIQKVSPPCPFPQPPRSPCYTSSLRRIEQEGGRLVLESLVSHDTEVLVSHAAAVQEDKGLVCFQFGIHNLLMSGLH